MAKPSKRLLFYILFIIFFSFSSFLMAQTSSELAFTKIEVAVANKDPDAIFDILSESYGQPYFSQLEDYVLSQARQLIIANDLDLARDVTLALIDNNLDNFEAVDLYTSIDKAIAKREATRLATAEKEQLEAMRVQVAAARTRQALQKEYKTITNTVSGETVYLDQDINNHFLPIAWDLVFGMANVGLFTDHTGFSIKYGLLLDSDILYNGDRFAAGADLGVDVNLLSFSGNQNMVFHVRAIPEFSIKKLTPILFFRLGFYGNFSNTTEKTSMKQFLSPVVGVALKNISFSRINNLKFAGYVDYLFGHFFYEDIKFAIDFGGSTSLILADLDVVDIYLHLGARCGLFVTDSGFQSQTRIMLGIGVGNND